MQQITLSRVLKAQTCEKLRYRELCDGTVALETRDNAKNRTRPRSPVDSRPSRGGPKPASAKPPALVQPVRRSVHSLRRPTGATLRPPDPQPIPTHCPPTDGLQPAPADIAPRSRGRARCTPHSCGHAPTLRSGRGGTLATHTKGAPQCEAPWANQLCRRNLLHVFQLLAGVIVGEAHSHQGDHRDDHHVPGGRDVVAGNADQPE